jgi:1-acyl-sn-glycerol-3-phosphate acyltransferase
MSRHVARYCRPLTIEREDALQRFGGPAIIMPNHTSHLDTPVVLSALPERLRARTAVAAAADRFYRHGRRGWWYSLFFNTFPIDRMQGGSSTLAYPLHLLRGGWSVLMYPEGTRTETGEIGHFHHGVAFLAMQTNVPVIPVFTDGLRQLMPKGTRTPVGTAPVHARIGRPTWLDAGTSVPEGTAQLESLMRSLAGAAPGQTGRGTATAAPQLTRTH